MKNSRPFICADQVEKLEKRVQNLLGEDAEIYIFSQTLYNRENKVQGLSISHKHYSKITIEIAKELVKGLDCVHVNLRNSNSDETVFALATKEDMQSWYNEMRECDCSSALMSKFYRNGDFTNSYEERKKFKEHWYTKNPPIIVKNESDEDIQVHLFQNLI